MKKTDVTNWVLPNGLKVLHVRCKGDVAYCGMYVGVGTRHELPNEHGYAHLTEHMLFKGTKKRTAAQIINRLEAVGGELNAYTTKEETVVYAVSLKRDLARAFELVADVTQHTTITDANLQKEREVVMDEIDSYLDSPAESIIDDFEDAVFDGYSIGRNILGSKQSLQAVTAQSLDAFYKRMYVPSRQLFFVMADVPTKQVEQWAARFLTQEMAPEASVPASAPLAYQAAVLQKEKHTSQAHCLIGGRAPSVFDSNKPVFSLLINILGGPSTNSRLNMSLRERHALVYQVEAQYTPYTDTGIWSVYLGCDHLDLPKAIKLVQNELYKLATVPLTENTLRRAKRQLLAQQLIASENKESWVLNAAKTYFLHGKLADYAQIEQKINAITAQQLQEVAARYFDPTNLSQLVFR